jgi:hypothetical protein
LIQALRQNDSPIRTHFAQVGLAQLSQLGEKSQQYQRGYSESFHYTALAGVSGVGANNVEEKDRSERNST